MAKIPRVLRVVLVPIIYVAWLVLWLTGQVVAAVIGLFPWLLVAWVRWRHGREAAEELRRSLVQTENKGRAWRSSLWTRRS